MIVTVGLCAVTHFSECFLARGTVTGPLLNWRAI